MSPTRRGLLALSAVIAVLVTIAPGEPQLPNDGAGRGLCFEDVGCEDGTPWDCRTMGNRLCGPVSAR